ncbi:MAG: helix-turn-helix domain-containing protein [Bacteroidetes bacterium]|jgi:transcriptional regulator with XRE-family HTH domain|nr:MAG: helix-turn-helix domain-containing protein [Bacteroidota bacterium]
MIEIMLKKGKTQREIAREIGVNSSTISKRNQKKRLTSIWQIHC